MASQWNETWAPSSWATNQWWHSPQTPHTTSTWTLPPPPPASSEPSSSLPPAPWPPTPPSRNNPADQQTDPRPARVPIPSSFKEDDEHYDSNLVFKSTLRKTVEPSAWSRAKGLAGMDIRDVTVAHLSRRGMEEYGLRPLSHGRFTGVILTRNVAETVLLSQIQKRLREDNVDVDATIEAIYKSKNLKPPDKVHQLRHTLGGRDIFGHEAMDTGQELWKELRAGQPGRAAHARAGGRGGQVQAAAEVGRNGSHTNQSATLAAPTCGSF